LEATFWAALDVVEEAEKGRDLAEMSAGEVGEEQGHRPRSAPVVEAVFLVRGVLGVGAKATGVRDELANSRTWPDAQMMWTRTSLRT
jgi:hypothetical protein